MTKWALDNKRESSFALRTSDTSDAGSHLSSGFDISLLSGLEDAEWLKWKCYIKFTSQNQCLVTIVPDNLDVIKRIMLGPTDTVISETASQIATDVAGTFAQTDSFSYHSAHSSSGKELPDDCDELQDKTPKETFRLRASTWDPVRGTVEASTTDIDDRLRTNSVGARVRPLSRLRAKHSFDLDSKEKLSENVTRVTKYVPLILPLYVCNCTLDDVIAFLIGENEEKAKASRFDLENEHNLEEQCKNINLAFRKYFVLSLFKCLLQGYDIPVTDVDQAFNKCETSVVTIDITEYLKVSNISSAPVFFERVD